MDNIHESTQYQQIKEQQQIVPMLILDDNYDLLFHAKKCSDIYQELIEDSISLKREISSLSYEQKNIPLPFNTSFDNISINLADQNRTETVSSNHSGFKCKCTKTKCQKNYCQCFKNGLICSKDCECFDCANKQEFFYALHSRSSAKGGCKCKKSHCLKNYCECHNQGRKCSTQCVCLECNNIGDDSSTQIAQILGEKGHKKIKTQTVLQMNRVQSNKTNIQKDKNNNFEEKAN